MAESKEQFGSNERPVSEEIPELFHYTSIATLSKILQSQTLWATRATHLNDSTETELIWPRITPIVVDYYRKELETLAEHDKALRIFVAQNGGASKIAQSDGSMMVDILRAQMLGDAVEPTRAPVFVVSFTTHGGDGERDKHHRHHGMLSQWRAYGGDDGVAIVLDAGGIERLLRDEEARFECWPMSLSTVVYDSSGLRLEERFNPLFDALGNFIRRFIEAKGNVLVLERSNTMKRLVEQIGVAFARFKHAAFHEETECRIVVGVTPESILTEGDSDDQLRSKAFKTIHYRPGQFGSIPYVQLFEKGENRLPITRIIVGPSRNQQANLETVQSLVRTTDIEVTASEIPFVGSISG